MSSQWNKKREYGEGKKGDDPIPKDERQALMTRNAPTVETGYAAIPDCNENEIIEGAKPVEKYGQGC